ncbi:MAG: 3-hydroxyacyl-CoA dehydrogenase family protein [Alphaproteobacteria bacterium]|nr:MAG: 3-hydroxyacyl-CoA dehydrogenase family protein [Alphaproteobacteria bacterium]
MIRTAAVIGLGTMGPGIGLRLARGGLRVRGHDIAPEARARAEAMRPAIEGAMDALGIAAREGGGFEVVDSLAAAVEGADLVIENVPERVETKAGVYAALAPLIGEEVIVASDTSGIPITRLQAHMAHPARMAGMHWSNPPHIVPMIEVIPGAETAPATAEAIEALIRGIGLVPVRVARDVPGFVENRVLYALLREVVDLVEQGVISARDIDTCVSWGIGYKLAVIGPMALMDMAGLDIYHAVASFLNRELSTRADVAPMIAAKLAEGRLGMKTGGGIYDYGPEEIARLQAGRAAKLVAIRRILEGGG